MRPPGFEPGLEAWEAPVLTRLDYGREWDGGNIEDHLDVVAGRPAKTCCEMVQEM